VASKVRGPALASGAFFIAIVSEAWLWENDPPMEITYELTQKDFTESFAAHRNRRPVMRWIRWTIAWILIVASALVLFGSIRTGNTKTLLPFFLIVAMWLVILAGGPLWWSARRQFLRQPGARGPRTVLFDDIGAHWRWNGGSSDVEWKNYVRSVEGKNHILLYTSPACFNIVPKRALGKEDLVSVLALLKQRILAER